VSLGSTRSSSCTLGPVKGISRSVLGPVFRRCLGRMLFTRRRFQVPCGSQVSRPHDRSETRTATTSTSTHTRKRKTICTVVRHALSKHRTIVHLTLPPPYSGNRNQPAYLRNDDSAGKQEAGDPTPNGVVQELCLRKFVRTLFVLADTQQLTLPNYPTRLPHTQLSGVTRSSLSQGVSLPRGARQ
jgi:hypothetical protein